MRHLGARQNGKMGHCEMSSKVIMVVVGPSLIAETIHGQFRTPASYPPKCLECCLLIGFPGKRQGEGPKTPQFRVSPLLLPNLYTQKMFSVNLGRMGVGVRIWRLNMSFKARPSLSELGASRLSEHYSCCVGFCSPPEQTLKIPLNPT